jgi:hypothetical protein
MEFLITKTYNLARKFVYTWMKKETHRECLCFCVYARYRELINLQGILCVVLWKEVVKRGRERKKKSEREWERKGVREEEREKEREREGERGRAREGERDGERGMGREREKGIEREIE